MIQTSIPMPLQIILDDVGWWSGRDGNKQNEPFRTGIPRDHVPADYRAIIRLGKELNMRPGAAMILGEWDTKNILRAVPSATWMGAKWDNRRWLGPWIEEAGDLIRINRDHFEIVLHGLAHEYWGPDGKATRSEFADMECNMRPADQVHLHLEYFGKLLDQHRLGPFPDNYAAPAGRHRFGAGERGFDGFLRKFGFKYASTPFSCMENDRPTQTPRLGVDCGVVTIDRGPDIMPWPDLDCRPSEPVPGPICGLHWPNILHLDPDRNDEVVDRWIAFLKPYHHMISRTLSRDSASCWTQYAFHECTTLTADENGLAFDFTRLDQLPSSGLGRQFIVKIAGPERMRFSAHDHNGMVASWDPIGRHHVLTLDRTTANATMWVTWQVM